MKIICWVNKKDENEIRKSSREAHFSSTLEDFDSNLTGGYPALLSITKAVRYWKLIEKITQNHPDSIFYFTEKIDSITYGELFVQDGDNVYHPMSSLPTLLKIIP